MLELNQVLEFSHTYCVAICAVLVPLNLLVTVLTLILVASDRPMLQVRQSASVAIVGSVLMILHVLTWFWVGVVQTQTFVLFSLGLCCMILNGWALWRTQRLRELLRFLLQQAQQSFRSTVQ